MIPNPKRMSVMGILLLALVACRVNAQADPKLPPIHPLATEPLAGQVIAVLPFTLVAADPSIESDTVYTPYRNHRAALLRADSLLGEKFQARAPEVNWVFPPQLRKVARRSAGVLNDPDQMGQAILRAPKLTTVPDPLRSSLRSLMAIVGGRLALAPAALGFSPEPGGRIRADLSLVLADSRTGKVLWRTVAYGRGGSPDEALSAAIAAVLPAAGGP